MPDLMQRDERALFPTDSHLARSDQARRQSANLRMFPTNPCNSPKSHKLKDLHCFHHCGEIRWSEKSTMSGGPKQSKRQVDQETVLATINFPRETSGYLEDIARQKNESPAWVARRAADRNISDHRPLQASNLSLTNSSSRSFVLDDARIQLGKSGMIEKFLPIWDRVVGGLGNKDPWKRRAAQARSSWDVLHPGRKFTHKLAEGEVTAESITTKLADYFAGKAVPLIPAAEATDIGTRDGDEWT